MPDIKHPFVNPKSDGGDATITRPSDWNAAHTWPFSIDVGSLSLGTDGNFLLQLARLQLSSSNRLTLGGATTRVVVFGQTDNSSPNVIGFPKQVPTAPFRVPNNYEVYIVNRLVMDSPSVRGVLEGNADMILSDDFGSRSRVVLAGRG